MPIHDLAPQVARLVDVHAKSKLIRARNPLIPNTPTRRPSSDALAARGRGQAKAASSAISTMAPKLVSRSLAGSASSRRMWSEMVSTASARRW